MIIFKTENLKDGKCFIGYAKNDNPHYLGSGIYLKYAIQKFGFKSFKKEILEELDESASIEHVMKRHDFWIKKYNSDNPNKGYNESVVRNTSKKKRLTKKIQVLIAPDDEIALNSIIIQKSMERGKKPISISKYVRQLITQHIIQETEI